MLWKRNNNLAGIINRLDAISGQIGANNDDLSEGIANKLVIPLAAKAEIEIAEQFELAGPLIVQQVSNNLAEHLQQKLTSAFLTAKADRETDSANIIATVYKTHNNVVSKVDDLEKRIAVIEGTTLMADDKAKTRTNCIIQGQEELARQAAIFDASNGDRMLTLYDKFRHLEQAVEHHHMLTTSKLNAIFSSLSVQLNELRPKDRIHYTTEPTLEWLMDNLDEIIEMANMAQAVRDNTAPRQNTIYKLVRAIRNLHLYSASDVKDEITSKINTWDNAQDFCRAA